MNTRRIGVIGGSGLDNPDILERPSNASVVSEWGEPAAIKLGTIDDVGVAILGRHGPEHTIPPSQVNFRANIDALSQLGCVAIVATTAVGSLREEIGRGDLVLLDQFIDFTRARKNSFHDQFEPGNPIHTPMSDPFDREIGSVLLEVAKNLDLKIHPTGTVITIEGPRFSTRAESMMFRSWGADVINMTIATECALAREAGLRYAAIAMSTDYDCWKTDEAPVTWDEIAGVFKKNASSVIQLVRDALPRIDQILA